MVQIYEIKFNCKIYGTKNRHFLLPKPSVYPIKINFILKCMLYLKLKILMSR